MMRGPLVSVFAMVPMLLMATDGHAQSPTCNIPQIIQTFTGAGFAQLNVAGQPCSLYFYNTANTSANAAQTAAQNLGANLASIQSQAENDAIQQALIAAGFSNAVVWIGGQFTTAAHGPNDFSWLDGSPANFINWNPGEPNNSSGLPGTNENCMQMVVNSGMWNDLVCGAEPCIPLLGCTGPMGTSVIEVNLCPEVTVSWGGGPVCFGDPVAMTASALFGSTPYSFAWFIPPSQIPVAMGASYTPNVAQQTTYAAGVQDVYGCTDAEQITITPVNCGDCSAFLPPIVTSTPTDCSGATGTATATPQGGVGPYTAVWSTNPVQTGLTITGLQAGNYGVTVTDADGCVETGNVAVATAQGGMTVTLQDVLGPSCPAECDGSAVAVAQDGQPPYTFQWSNNAVGDMADGFCAGNHSVLVTDGNGCEVTADFDLQNPEPLQAVIDAVPTSCPGFVNGSATATVTGGTPPYSVDWQGENPAALAEGGYQATITDSRGCTVFANYVIEPGTGIGIAYAITDNLCFGGQAGSATVTLSAGQLPYTVIWTDPFNNVLQTDALNPGMATLAGLPQGTYLLSVSDAAGCPATSAFTITEPSQGLTMNVVPQDVLCGGQSNGQVQVSQSGLIPFQYAVSDVFGNVVSSVSNQQGAHVFTGLSAQTYFISATDANGCQTVSIFTLTEPAPLTGEINSTPVSCFGAANGTAQVSNLNGGTPPYQPATWNDPLSQSGNMATGLAMGSYTATVTDANGCQLQLSVQIDQPLPMQLTANYLTDTCGMGRGAAYVEVTLGTPPYSFAWGTPNGSSDYIAYGLYVGEYAVVVTDARGCTASATVEVKDDLPYPFAAFEYRMEGQNFLDQTVQFINNSVGTNAWKWNFGNAKSSTEKDPRHRYNAEGDYLVQLLASNGYCADTAYGYVTINPLLGLYIPTAFTPGINGINDYFYPQGEGLELESYEMWVYDRWGKLVWQTRNFARKWDGTNQYSLEMMPTGVYTYHIRFREFADLDRYEVSGSVHLLRD